MKEKNEWLTKTTIIINNNNNNQALYGYILPTFPTHI